MKILYHSPCVDGWAAAYLFKKVYPDAELIPVKYGDEPPDGLDGQDIVIVDFSYGKQVLLRINQRARSLLVLDHHKTAQANCEGLDFCQFDMTRSGAMMAYDYLVQHPGRKLEPYRKLIEYIQDRDLWGNKLADTKAVSAYLRCVQMDECNWDVLLEIIKRDWAGLLDRGYAILDYQERSIEEHMSRQYIDNRFLEYQIPIVNCSDLSIISELLNRLCKGYPFAASYYYDEIRKLEIWSLRSDKNGIDVSNVATIFGGGGHKHAAGFTK